MKLNKKEIPIKIIFDCINYYIELNDLPSISVGIVGLKDKLTHSFGKYDKEKNKPANFQTLYNIASLSKIYTTIELLKLVEKGELSLKDKINEYIPEFPSKRTTIEDLMVHKSGLTRDGDFNFWLDKKFPTDEELIKSIKDLKLETEGLYKYSNYGYALLGIILKKKGVNILQGEIKEAKGYGSKTLNYQEIYDYIDMKSFTSSFGLYKNINDLSDLVQKFLTKDTSMLKKESYKNIFDIHLKIKDKDEDDICLAFNKWKNKEVYEFSGHSFGFESHVLIDFKLEMGIAVLVNSTNKVIAEYISKGIRKFVEMLSNKKYVFQENSLINGFYRGKNYDVIALDFSDKLILLKPSNPYPLYEYEEYNKLEDYKYLTVDKKDPYYKENLTIEVDTENKVKGFKQGGWGFKKIS